ncbi:molting protein mlt-4 [Anaeramoeba flamelloides]|uniref:Molting protein mlt-4 n=1 Tax=Anaeramoeba flamelloides TaxID=1746091 RepID=A0ABQ8YVY3_9EUKA|nr:molting protein mlt-4 [Anaeramoeba flamelloides]
MNQLQKELKDLQEQLQNQQNKKTLTGMQVQEIQTEITKFQNLLGILPEPTNKNITAKFSYNKKSKEFEINSGISFLELKTIVNTKIEKSHYVTYFDISRDEVIIEDDKDLTNAIQEYLGLLRDHYTNESTNNPPLQFNLYTKNKYAQLLKKNSINIEEKKNIQLINEEENNINQQTLTVTFKISFSKQFPFRYIKFPLEMPFFELQENFKKIFGNFSEMKFRDLEQELIPVSGEDSWRYCISEVCAMNILEQNKDKKENIPMKKIFNTLSATKSTNKLRPEASFRKKKINKYVTTRNLKEVSNQQEPNTPQLKFTYSKHLIVRDGRLDSIETRFDQESINAYDLSGLKPIHVVFLSSKNPQETAKKLQNLGAELNSLTTKGETVLHMLCKSENLNLETLKFLLENKIDPNVQNKSGQTALSYLCERADCNPKFVERLIQGGADPNLVRADGCSPILLACRSKLSISIIKLLLNSGVDLTLKSKSGHLPLHGYLTTGFLKRKTSPKVVQLLISKDNSLTKTVDTRGLLPIHLGCRDCFNSPEIIKILIGDGEQINQLSSGGYAPIHYLCQAHPINLTSLKLLLNHEKIDLNLVSTAKSFLGWNAIHFLCTNKSLNIQIIKEFFEKGLNFNLQTENDLLTPIHIICKKRNFKRKKKKSKSNDSKITSGIYFDSGSGIVSDSGSDSDSGSGSGSGSESNSNPRQSAKSKSNSGSNSDEIIIIQEKISNDTNSNSISISNEKTINEDNDQDNININKVIIESIWNESEDEDEDEVEGDEQKNNGANGSINDDEEDELNEQIGEFDEMLSNVCSETLQENTIIEIVTHLVENNNINLELKDKNGKTAFDYLWEKQSKPYPEEIELMKLFIKKGLKINKQHKEDLTLMDIIPVKDQLINHNLLTKAISIGLDPEKRNKNGMSALHIACCSKNREITIIRKLLKYNIQTNICDYYGQTALHLVCKNDPNLYKIKLLLNLAKNPKININQQNKFGLTALHLLSKQNPTPIESILFLLNNDADTSITDHFGNNALLFACYSTNPSLKLIKLLIDKKSDVNIKVHSGWLKDDTPLIACCKKSQNKEIISLLLQNGANPNDRDKMGNTPLHFLFSIKPFNIKAILLLVKSNANLNLKNYLSGNSPIHLISKFKNFNQNFLNFLVINDANFDLQNDKSLTPFDLMKENTINIIKTIQKLMMEINESQKQEIKELLLQNFYSTELQRKLNKIKNKMKKNKIELEKEKMSLNNDDDDEDDEDDVGNDNDNNVDTFDSNDDNEEEKENKNEEDFEEEDFVFITYDDDEIVNYVEEDDDEYYQQQIQNLKDKVKSKKKVNSKLEKEYSESKISINKLKQENKLLKKKNDQNLKEFSEFSESTEKKNTKRIVSTYKLYSKLKFQQYKYKKMIKKLKIENRSLKKKLLK